MSTYQHPQQPTYGLIGHPVSHSFSPDFFNEKFKREKIPAAYRAFDLPDIRQLPALIAQYPELKGLNVTIPHKENVQAYLDDLSADAKAIGAVNCIAIRQGKLTGYNTDWMGFWESLAPLLQPWHRQALILGSGGASKAVQYALKQHGISFQVVSRSKKEGALPYEALDEKLLQSHTLLIQTTPLGMWPDVAAAPPLPYHLLGKNHLLYDLIYTPAETLFLQKGKAAGARIKNGLEMLELQALASWQIWQGSR